MKNLKKENGAITIIVLVSVLFMVSFLISSYILISNKVKTQKDMIAETRKIYENPLTMEEIYNSYIASNEMIPIYNLEQLLNIGNGTTQVINNKYYSFKDNATYLLMNDLECDDARYSEILEELRNKLPQGGFEGNGHKITVTNNSGEKFICNDNNNFHGILVNIPEDYKDKIYNIVDGVPIPKGFKYVKGTQDTGSVITDAFSGEEDKGNEFVWIPVTETYIEDDFGPLTGIDRRSKCVYDSQEQLDYYYGERYFNYNEDFNYAEDKTKIEASINKYKGFYVGRYETTIDEEGNVGSKVSTPVLTAGHTVKEGVNPNNNEAYYYRWYGLYKVQKDMYVGKDSVFSSMITSKEWDKIMDYTGYGSATRGTDTYTTKPDLSGSAYKNITPAQYDVSKNIYDLAGNVEDWTLKPIALGERNSRGGVYLDNVYSASFSSRVYLDQSNQEVGSRCALYIK